MPPSKRGPQGKRMWRPKVSRRRGPQNRWIDLFFVWGQIALARNVLFKSFGCRDDEQAAYSRVSPDSHFDSQGAGCRRISRTLAERLLFRIAKKN
jgi:hypothetical protein